LPRPCAGLPWPRHRSCAGLALPPGSESPVIPGSALRACFVRRQSSPAEFPVAFWRFPTPVVTDPIELRVRFVFGRSLPPAPQLLGDARSHRSTLWLVAVPAAPLPPGQPEVPGLALRSWTVPRATSPPASAAVATRRLVAAAGSAIPLPVRCVAGQSIPPAARHLRDAGFPGPRQLSNA